MCLDLVCLRRLACGAIFERILEKQRYGENCQGACRRPRFEIVACEETQTPCHGCMTLGGWVFREDPDGRCIWWDKNPYAPRGDWCRGEGVLGEEEAQLLWNSCHGRPGMESGAAWERRRAEERREEAWREERRRDLLRSRALWPRRRTSDPRNYQELDWSESRSMMLRSSEAEEQEDEWEQWPDEEFEPEQWSDEEGQLEQWRNSQQRFLEEDANPPPPYSPPRSPRAS